MFILFFCMIKLPRQPLSHILLCLMMCSMISHFTWGFILPQLPSLPRLSFGLILWVRGSTQCFASYTYSSYAITYHLLCFSYFMSWQSCHSSINIWLSSWIYSSWYFLKQKYHYVFFQWLQELSPHLDLLRTKKPYAMVNNDDCICSDHQSITSCRGYHCSTHCCSSRCCCSHCHSCWHCQRSLGR